MRTQSLSRSLRAGKRRSLLCAAVLIAGSLPAQTILNTNLIVNSGAEAGSAGSTTAVAASIPGWTVMAGKPNVLPYGLVGYEALSDPGPPPDGSAARGFQYFSASGSQMITHTLSQTIDVSPGVSLINSNSMKYNAAAYLGSANGLEGAQMMLAFQNAAGQTINNVVLGPVGPTGPSTPEMFLQRQIGIVPPNTARITVSLSLSSDCPNAASCRYGAADSLSLVLTAISNNASLVLGTNLVSNPGAEAGPAAAPTSTVPYIPGWSTTRGTSVAAYGGTAWIAASAPGPANRGINLFVGGSQSTMYQDIDVSPAAALIDSGQLTYEISAWLGVGAPGGSPTLTYLFFDWSGKQLATTANLGPLTLTTVGLIEASASGTLPAGTRRVTISLSFAGYLDVADDVDFTLAGPSGPPVITPGSIISAGSFGGFSAIAPGSWIEIYGDYLTSAPLRNNCPGFAGSCWANADFNNGVAPTSLDGVSVSVGGQAAFIDFTSPGQVNALVPSNAPVGPSMITLTNANGTSDPFPIYINQTQPGLLAPPSFLIGGKQYVAGILSDGSFALPPNASPGVASRPAKPGETVVLYGVGFGDVLPAGIEAGTVVTQQNQLKSTIQFMFGSASASIPYDGLAPNFTGLYQFNIVVPNVSANNALPLSFNLGGAKGSQVLYIAVE